MTGWVVAGWLITGGAVAVLFSALAMAYRRANRRETDTEWDSAGFSLERYGPMARLLEDEDAVFLASQPGYRSEMGAEFRRERRRIFRLYLRELSRDFHRLHAEAREIVADSDAEHAELVELLLRQQVRFIRFRAGLEVRLALGRLGLGKVDVRTLVDGIEAMRLDLARFTAVASAT
jgi:hypothetical protein